MLLNLCELLPFSLELGQGHMFDVLEGQKPEERDPEDPLAEKLARYLAADLSRHPARLEGTPDHPLVYARVLGAFRPGRDDPQPPAGSLEAARARYSAVGLAALETFVAWGGRPPRGARRKDPYRT